jgi:hypothetical protein
MMKKIISTGYIFALCLVFVSAAEAPTQSSQIDTTSPWLVQPPTDYETAINTIRDQLATLKAGDSSKAYYAYTTKDFRKAFSLDDFKSMVRRFKVFSQNRSFQSESSDFDGSNIIKLKGKLIAIDGDTMKVAFDMVLEDGDWKIQNIQLSQIAPRNQHKNLPGPRPKAN